MLGQGQATRLSLNTHKAQDVRSKDNVLYVAEMVVSAVMQYANTVDTCTQVGHVLLLLYTKKMNKSRHTSGQNQFFICGRGQNLKNWG